jgi:hypothetical protein
MKRFIAAPQQLPEYVRAEFPAFVEFIKAYYQWLDEEYSIGRLEELVDIDDTVDGFVKYFRKQLDVYGISTKSVDPRQTLKHIKELYSAKGSPQSFQFLFKLLYGKNSSVIHPWDYAFKPSEGKWTQDISILVFITSGSALDLAGNSITITDVDGNTYRTVVRDINQRKNGVVEVFIKRISPRAKLVTMQTLDGGITANVFNTTTKAKVYQSGKGFRIGQVFPVNSSSGVGSLIKVKAVNKDGGIKSVDIISFGSGYLADFNVILSPQNAIDAASLGSYIELGSISYPTNDVIDPQNEQGSIIQHDYTALANTYMQDLTYVGNVLAEFTSQSLANVTAADEYAIINLYAGNLCIYPGYYLDSTNIVGDLVYIQDSYYYQAFSYVTALDETIDTYRDVLLKVVHPAGTKHFGLYQIDNTFQLDPVVAASLNLIAKADALREYVNAVGEIAFAFEKQLSDSAVFTDTQILVASFYRTFNHSAVVTDAFGIDSSIETDGDSAVITDDYILLVPGIQVADGVNATAEIDSKDATKYTTDSSIIDTLYGGLYMDPLYVYQNPPYWLAGYLENERAFTN